MVSFDSIGLLKIIQATSFGASRRKAIFELAKRAFTAIISPFTLERIPEDGGRLGGIIRDWPR